MFYRNRYCLSWVWLSAGKEWFDRCLETVAVHLMRVTSHQKRLMDKGAIHEGNYPSSAWLSGKIIWFWQLVWKQVLSFSWQWSLSQNRDYLFLWRLFVRGCTVFHIQRWMFDSVSMFFLLMPTAELEARQNAVRCQPKLLWKIILNVEQCIFLDNCFVMEG